jgi:hypothetical protein
VVTDVDVHADSVDATTASPGPAGGRTPLRRAAPWLILGVVAIVVATIVALLIPTDEERPPPLSASNPEPDGAMAVAEVLRQHGVDVIETTTLADTERATSSRANTTILLVDPGLILDEDQHDRLLSEASRVVVVEPTDSALEELAPGVVEAGTLNGSLDADCDLDAVQKARTVDGPATAYRLGHGEQGTACLTVAGDLSALIEVRTNGTSVTVLGAGSTLRNDRVTTAGNAALALNLLGRTETLIWYFPSETDRYEDTESTLADLQAPWTVPLTVLLALVALAAAVWRGRRFGPLVLENLPVVVRSGETMEGRARLYERASARLHALDALRIGTVARLARVCSLPRTASVGEVVDAVAALTGRPRADVAALLVDDEPAGDGDLIRLSDALLRLEADAAARARPDAPTTPAREKGPHV